jgi:hypothetical protein
MFGYLVYPTVLSPLKGESTVQDTYLDINNPD